MKYHDGIDEGGIGIAAGSIDEESVAGGLKPEHVKHIFVREKAAWFEVPPGEERHEGHEESFQRRIDAF